MKRSSLLLLTALTLLAAAAVLPQKVRLMHRSHARSVVQAQDPYLTPAALRWRQSQRSHWRACMLQH